MSNIDYQSKYLKYKIKYFKLKNMYGGANQNTYIQERIKIILMDSAITQDKKLQYVKQITGYDIKLFFENTEFTKYTDDVKFEALKKIEAYNVKYLNNNTRHISFFYNEFLEELLIDRRYWYLPNKVMDYFLEKSLKNKQVLHFIKLFDEISNKIDMLKRVTTYLGSNENKIKLLNDNYMILRMVIDIMVIDIIITQKNKSNIDEELIKLLATDTNTKHQDFDGETPLTIALHYKSSNDIYKIKISDDIIKSLITNENKNIKNKQGETPLMIALHYKLSDDIIKLLITNENKNIKNRKDETPLMIATTNQLSHDVITLLDTDYNI